MPFESAFTPSFMINHPTLLRSAYRTLLGLTHGRGAQTLSKLDAALLPTPRRIELEPGINMELAPDSHLFGYLMQSHEAHVRDWVNEWASTARSFVDVGANIGYFAGCALARLPAGASLILLEPDPDNFRATAWTEAAARARNVRLERFNGAVSEQNGELFLHRHPRFCTYHSVSSTAPTPEEEANTVRVPAVALAGFLAERGMATVDCLKIDVEGHEDAVLRGAAELFRAGKVRHAMVEVTPGDGVALAFELGNAGGYAKQYFLDGRWQLWTEVAQIVQRMDIRLDLPTA